MPRDVIGVGVRNKASWLSTAHIDRELRPRQK
jgi:hypothetical protein